MCLFRRLSCSDPAFQAIRSGAYCGRFWPGLIFRFARSSPMVSAIRITVLKIKKAWLRQRAAFNKTCQASLNR